MSHVNKNWIIGILISIIGVLCSLFVIIHVTCYDKIMDMLSLLSSILSLVLSVFAIFYSYHSIVRSDESSDNASKVFTKIEAYNNDMIANNNQLLQTVLMIKDKVAVIESKQYPEDRKNKGESIIVTVDNKPKQTEVSDEQVIP